MQLLSGSGHIQYRGITPGSSEEMKNSRLFSVSPSLALPSWKQKRYSAVCRKKTTKINAQNVCMFVSASDRGLTAPVSEECEDNGASKASPCSAGTPDA